MIRFILKPFYRIKESFRSGKIYHFIINKISFFNEIKETRGNESPIQLKGLLKYKVLGKNSGPYWPIHETSEFVGSWRNVYVGIDAAPGISPGCYIQAIGKIIIDDYAQIAPQVGIISANHFMLDIRNHIEGKVVIGKYCRIGMGSIILPNVVLGDFVTVAAGSVVTKSFENGYCVIAGNPATIVEDYSNNEKIKKKFSKYKNVFEYNGYIKNSEFEAFRKSYLNV